MTSSTKIYLLLHFFSSIWGQQCPYSSQYQEQGTCGCTRDVKLIRSNLPSCSVPYEDFPSARNVYGNAPRVDQSFPTWINYELFQRGQQFARNNFWSVGLAAALGRAANMNTPDIRDVIMFTQVMSSSPIVCARILSSFAAKNMVWFQDIQGGPPRDDSDFLQTVNRIRWIHIKVARDIDAKRRKDAYNPEIVDESTFDNVTINDAVWDAFQKDLIASPIPEVERRLPPHFEERNTSTPYFNQQSLSLFLFNAFAYPILAGGNFGIVGSDLWAFNHLSAVIGYSLGIDDAYNLALQPNFKELKEYYSKIFKGYIVPGFFHLDKRSKVTLENIMKGTQINIPGWTLQLYLYRLLTVVMRVPGYNLRKLFTIEDTFQDAAWNGVTLPNLLNSKNYRDATNNNSIQDYLRVGERYYGANYTNQWGRARYSFYTPIRND